MLNLIRSAERGHADHGWLNSHHSFSFGSYHNSERMGFRDLRVVNQDRVAGAGGFPTHGHRDMEIISYVLEGALAHEDSLGNRSVMPRGEVQIMSAGTGVTHSEFNDSAAEELQFLQMWVLPRERGGEPRYGQLPLLEADLEGSIRLVVAPEAEDAPLAIRADARMHVGRLDGGQAASVELAPGRGAYVHNARGRVKLNGQVLEPGDGAAIEDEARLEFEGFELADFVVFDLA